MVGVEHLDDGGGGGEEEEDLFVINDTIEGPRAPVVKPGRISGHSGCPRNRGTPDSRDLGRE
jgi:hypothetical protein